MTKFLHVLSVDQFTDRDFLEKLFEQARGFEVQDNSGNLPQLLKNKIVACIFYEPSTRTRLSFEAAVQKLGGSVISMESASRSSSAVKGESLEDTIKVLNSYADAIVLRHPQEGAAKRAASVSKVPIINAGDGGSEHPTQALLDLYTIKKSLGRLDSLKIAFGFDPKHSRTIRSLALLLTHFENNVFTFVCPPALNPADDVLEDLRSRGAKFEIVDNLNNFGDYDIFYANRLQQERFEDKSKFEKYRRALVLTEKLVKGTKTLIMDPLPRIDEIETLVDGLPNAIYFKQAQNGLYVRMALLAEILK